MRGHNIPLSPKELGDDPAHSPSLRRIKGLIDIHASVHLSFNKLSPLWAAIEDEGKREKKKLPLHAGNSHLDPMWK